MIHPHLKATMTNPHRKCSRGYTRRHGYIRKNTGTYVKGTCVRSTNKKKAISGTRKRCPNGQIARASYVRRVSSNVAKKGYTKKISSGKIVKIFPKQKSTYVKSACVKDLGKPGKLPAGAPQIGPLKKGELAKHGYSYKLPESVRHLALEKAVKEYGPLSTYRKLNAVSKLTVRTSPTASFIFAGDRNWIRSKYSTQGQLKAF
jgi:hypothetical protein